MKTIFSISFLLFVSIASSAQRIDVTVGPSMDTKQIMSDIGLSPRDILKFNGPGPLFFIPKEKRTYQGFGMKDKSYVFAVFENYLTYAGIKKLTSEIINEEIVIEKFIVFKDKLYVLFSQELVDRDEVLIYVNEVSDDMVVLGTPILLHTFKDLTRGRNISVSTSADDRHILLSREQETKSKKPSIECKVLDFSFAEVWSSHIELEGGDDLRIQSIELDNAGNLHMLTATRIYQRDKPSIFTYFWNDKLIRKFNVGLSAGDNFGARLILLNNEVPYVVGLNKDGKTASYFVDRVNTKSQTIENINTTPMPDDFYKALNFRGFDTFEWSVRDIVALEDNSIVASIEAKVEVDKDGYSVYHSYNAYLISFDETGKKKWSNVVHKKQSTRFESVGHLLVPAGNSVLLIYNDQKNNIGKHPQDKEIDLFGGKDAMMTVQEFDSSGNAQKYPLSKEKQVEGYSLHLWSPQKIKNGLYYLACFKSKGLLSIESQNLILKIN